jgi:glycosyltransferase involved in cell wall biosynthesis
MTKILFYTDCFIFGGSEKVLVNLLSSSVMKQKFHMELLYNYNKDYEKNVKNKISNDVNTIPIKLPENESFFYQLEFSNVNKWIISIIKMPLKFLRWSGLYALIIYFKLKKEFESLNPDILFINNGGYPGALSCLVAVFAASSLAKRPKIIMNINNLAFEPKFSFLKKVDLILFHRLDLIITASKAAGKRLNEVRGAELSKWIDIPNTTQDNYLHNRESIFYDEFQIDRSTVIIGAAGLLTKRKGFDVLIRAINQLKDEICEAEFRLFIFGEGEEKKSLQALIDKNNLNKLIVLAGNRSSIDKYLSQVDIFVLPSRANEDFPYVIVEAMSLAKPIIGTHVAGIPEQVIHGYNGFIVPPEDYLSLSQSIKTLINKPELRKKMGDLSRSKFEEEYQYDKVISKYVSLFNNISC